ncbi:Reverse transcriptase (RNA-dependent DNA polymerase) [Spongiibacter sp. IMCC21906]|uniref:antiviral reverse transcriptase Drt3a n=1 Tax=Spongiibacter sp. IMCC21906 TaxID=1620392 RepID=UPI00062DD8D6|nr:antiviral reverse transcriptase Drt3a [Spongiibacter sp. IMCC21906]AKH69688.1 Reverse transcriptase (RNA-dependent DNA polymerase) [Spongiibacter sp. IMCC21906]
MLDQMFTAENFRHIYDAENRKGLDLASRYFPSLKSHTLAVRDKMKDIREHRAAEPTMAAEVFEARLLELKAELTELKAAKSAAVDDLMDDISQKVLKPNFKIDLSQKTGPKGKPVFCIDAEPETFFVIKQLQRNIHRIYGVKQANRHDLVCQLRDILGSKFPFELVRTDISSFYESIDRKRLIEKLDRDQLLSPASKKYIKQVLDSYGVISGTTTGIPRGVGISAYLAELYLRAVDKKIRAIPGLVLYCRFVDDIVAVFARPPIGKDLGSFKDMIIAIFGDSGLTHNAVKTLEFKLDDTDTKKFEYLGYRFLLSPGKFEISPSAAKVAKYRARMDAAFVDYWRERPVNPKKAFRKLIGRIKFLTGNTRLSNSKSCAVTGIYFNNSIVTNLSSLELLDKRLKTRINELKRPSLQKQLKKLKFTTGFEQRRYHNFSTRELQVIVRVWKHV